MLKRSFPNQICFIIEIRQWFNLCKSINILSKWTLGQKSYDFLNLCQSSFWESSVPSDLCLQPCRQFSMVFNWWEHVVLLGKYMACCICVLYHREMYGMLYMCVVSWGNVWHVQSLLHFKTGLESWVKKRHWHRCPYEYLSFSWYSHIIYPHVQVFYFFPFNMFIHPRYWLS